MIKMKKISCVVYGKYENFQNPKLSYILQKPLAFLSVAVSVAVTMKR